MSRAKHAERGKLVCHYCEKRPGVTTDHVVPRAFGGPDARWNYVACCVECNAAKGPTWPDHEGCAFCASAVSRFLSDPNKQAKAANRLAAQAEELTKGIDASQRHTRDLRKRRNRINSLYAQIATYDPSLDETIVHNLIK